MPKMLSCYFCGEPVSSENGQIYHSLKVGDDHLAKMCTHHYACRHFNETITHVPQRTSMKTLTTLLLITLLYGCDLPRKTPAEMAEPPSSMRSIIFDSCEYVEYDYGLANQHVYALTHKGNCKFCEARKLNLIRGGFKK